MATRYSVGGASSELPLRIRGFTDAQTELFREVVEAAEEVADIATDVSQLEQDVAALQAEGLPSNFINVKNYGALGDGSTDDSAAIATAKAALSAANGTLYFPPGTYRIGGSGILTNFRNGTVVRGAGANATTIKAADAYTGWMMQGGGTLRGGFVFEDITFDGNNTTAGVYAMSGVLNDDITFRRCRVQNASRFISAQGVTALTVEDCWVHGGAVTSRTAIAMSGGCRNVYVRRSQFLYWQNGITADTGNNNNPDEQSVENIVIEDCFFDGAWQYYPSVYSNSGDSITYASSASSATLTDTEATFTEEGFAEGDTIRALEVARSGSLTTCTRTRLTDTGATFVTEGVMEGDIVRCGDLWAIVSGVESETALSLEGWLDDWMPAFPPAASSEYAAYRVVLGQLTLSGLTDTQATVTRWFRPNGDAVLTPEAGSLYEVCGHPNYCAIHFEYGAKNCVIARNTILRSWSDQISYYGNRGKIEDNIVKYGMDVGITINGSPNDGYNSIRRNTLIHNGSQNIWIGTSKDNVVSHNLCIAGSGVSTLGYQFGGGITLQGGSGGNVVEHNFIDGKSRPNSCFGIGVTDSANNVIRFNTVRNVLLPAWEPLTAYALNDRVRNGNKQYRCTIAGTSAASGGPVGWTSNEADGTAGWTYNGANAEIILTCLDKTDTTGNRVYDNDTELPVFHYSRTAPFTSSNWVDGSFYGTIYGAGDPEGAITAGVGTMYLRNDGTAGAFLKTSGVGNTGWTELATVA